MTEFKVNDVLVEIWDSAPPSCFCVVRDVCPSGYLLDIYRYDGLVIGKGEFHPYKYVMEQMVKIDEWDEKANKKKGIDAV